MDTPKAIQRVRQYADLICQEMKPSKVLLFGSYARGDWRNDSDIDVAVGVEKIEGDYLKAAGRLHKLAWPIDYRIEPHLLESGDDPSGFLEHILKHGIVIYDRDHPAA